LLCFFVQGSLKISGFVGLFFIMVVWVGREWPFVHPLPVFLEWIISLTITVTIRDVDLALKPLWSILHIIVAHQIHIPPILSQSS